MTGEQIIADTKSAGRRFAGRWFWWTTFCLMLQRLTEVL
jgi:hypothetical protein